VSSSANALEVLLALVRWFHVASAVLWLGPQVYFAFVDPPLRSRWPDATRRALDLELTPRLLAWLRWGAAGTWLLGFVLLFLTYYRTGLLLDLAAIDPARLSEFLLPDGRPSPRVWIPGFLGLLAAVSAYELLARLLRRSDLALVVLTLALLVLAGETLGRTFHHSGRAVFVQMGAMLGSILASNVWSHIWPAERRAWIARREGREPLAADLALSAHRMRQNSLLTLPLLFLMLSNHHALLYAGDPWPRPLVASAVLALGVLAALPLYRWAKLEPAP